MKDSMRFRSTDLANLEEKVRNAGYQADAKEKEIFRELSQSILSVTQELKHIAHAVALVSLCLYVYVCYLYTYS